MPVAAPDYLAERLREIGSLPPGHRHRLYFAAWNSAWDRSPELDNGAYAQHLGNIASDRAWSEMARALADRQAGVSTTDPRVFRRIAVTRSPFVTGVGIEHPSENGFAFYDPHGVPFLPASSLKGILRRAAEELALWTAAPWDLAHVWWWFGFEAGSVYLQGANEDSLRPEMAASWRRRYEDWAPEADLSLLAPFFKAALPDEHKAAWDSDPLSFLLTGLRTPVIRRSISSQGRLVCWDTFVQPPGNTADALAADVMAVHFPGYYQGRSRSRPSVHFSEQWPDDSEPPIPLKLLVLPSGTSFPCTVANASRPSDPAELTATFEQFAADVFAHAFAELSFGAKGSAGYGWLSPDSDAEALEQQARLDLLSKDLSPLDALQLRVRQATDPAIVHHILNFELGELDADDQLALAGAIREAYRRFGIWDQPRRGQRGRVTKVNTLLGDSER